MREEVSFMREGINDRMVFGRKRISGFADDGLAD